MGSGLVLLTILVPDLAGRLLPIDLGKAKRTAILWSANELERQEYLDIRECHQGRENDEICPEKIRKALCRVVALELLVHREASRLLPLALPRGLSGNTKLDSELYVW